MVNENSKLNQLMDVAQSLVQTKGYNAMSYRDLASEVGIKTSSIHYYFPNKDDLGIALLQRYRSALKEAIKIIDSEIEDPYKKIERYIELFVDTAHAGKICLGGMCATDSETLSDAMRIEIKYFYTENEAWLTAICKQGKQSGKFNFEGSAKIKAELIFAMLEGALISARLFNDEKRIVSAGAWIKEALS